MLGWRGFTRSKLADLPIDSQVFFEFMIWFKFCDSIAAAAHPTLAQVWGTGKGPAIEGLQPSFHSLALTLGGSTWPASSRPSVLPRRSRQCCRSGPSGSSTRPPCTSPPVSRKRPARRSSKVAGGPPCTWRRRPLIAPCPWLFGLFCGGPGFARFLLQDGGASVDGSKLRALLVQRCDDMSDDGCRIEAPLPCWRVGICASPPRV